MKRSVMVALVVSCALGYGLAARAQDKPAAKEHTMTGCLQKGATADTFVLNNTEGKGPKTTVILESKAKLAPHVGHKIDITGTDVSTKEVAGMKEKPQKGDHYMRVSAMKMVSAECK